MSDNKYLNGKIYRIWNTANDDVYVGSTCNPLFKRMSYHRGIATHPKYTHRALYKMMSEVGVDNFRIELIEDHPCENKEQLRKREGFYIRQMGTLNMKIEDRSRQEYNELNKEKKQEYMIQYREDKKEQLLQQTKEYRENNKDKIKQYKIDSKEHILAQSKEYRQRTNEQQSDRQKQDTVKAWKNMKVKCPCGGSYTNCHKAEHLKCVRHKTYEQSLETHTL